MIPSTVTNAYFSRAQPPSGCTLSTRTGSIPGEAGESNKVWEQETCKVIALVGSR